MGKNKGMSMLEFETVLEIFDLQVYRLSKDSGYFWRNNANPQGFGPFKTVEATLLQYAKVVKESKELQAVADNIIKVDFKARKRV